MLIGVHSTMNPLLLALLISVAAAADNYKIKNYFVKFHPNATEKTFVVDQESHFDVLGDVKEMKIKIGKNLEIDSVSVFTSKFIFRGNPDFIGLALKNDEYSYDKKTEILTVKLSEVNKKTASEGAYVSIRYKGKIADEATKGPIYVTKNGVIVADLKKDTHTIVPYVVPGKMKVGFHIVTGQKEKVEVKGLDAPGGFKHIDNWDETRTYYYSATKDGGFEQISFKISPQ
ncbi:unnamed protein product [Caenorhabditis bovis]|uniref:Uncharacterized protein n=1 Tax=Caenorhabditis bovis TaxID=2654633 RepID=A0A8S1F5C3_9PELO|nr:unnamed protein product [Caenorhabditis bovis]